MLLDLDDPASLDSSVVGAKAAWLAQGRRVGLPILPGFVVPVDDGRDAATLGAERLATSGTGAARLAIAEMNIRPALVADLPAAVAHLGGPLVVRSSSPLEADAAWAGAFTSYIDVSAESLPTAIRGCWASAFSNGAIQRAAQAGVPPGDLRLGVIVQPAIMPDTGGTARLSGDATLIVAVRGSPAPLLQGWDPGVHGQVDGDGAIHGSALAGLVGPAALRSIAATMRSAVDLTGATSCEWAIVDGATVLLQLGRDRAPAAPASTEAGGRPLAGDEDDLARLARIARTVRHSPGALGDALVLPWALGEAAGRPARRSTPALDARASTPAPAEGESDPGTAFAEAVAMARALTIEAWREPGDRDADTAIERARVAIAALRGTEPVAAAVAVAIRPTPDPMLAAALLERLATVRAGLVAVGVADDPEDAWHLDPDAAAAALADPSRAPRARRPRLDPWEPFQAAVILATGERRSGAPSGPGLGAGRLTVVDDARSPGRVWSRDVILAPRPIPHLAPLLWDATAVITAGGGPGAHLFESARALGLPAVSGLGLDDLLGGVLGDGPGTWAVAVDGTAGVVAFTPW